MAVTHTWSVSDPNLQHQNTGRTFRSRILCCLERLSSEETVDGTTYSISSANQISLNTDNLDPATFTAFADLTAEQVVGWAKATIDANAAEGEGVTVRRVGSRA